MSDPYIQYLHEKIDAIHPAISRSLENVSLLDSDSAARILAELLASACQATNQVTIMTARNAIAKIQGDWLEQHLSDAVTARLNLDDDLEYRRLLELLELVRPSLLSTFVSAGLSSPNPDVREVADDYASGRHKPRPPL